MDLGRLPAAMFQHALQASTAAYVARQLDAARIEARLERNRLPLRLCADGLDAQMGLQDLAAPRLHHARYGTDIAIRVCSDVLLHEVDEAPLGLQQAEQQQGSIRRDRSGGCWRRGLVHRNGRGPRRAQCRCKPAIKQNAEKHREREPNATPPGNNLLSHTQFYTTLPGRAERINPIRLGAQAWRSGRAQAIVRSPMRLGSAPDADLSLPDLDLELLEDVSPRVAPGFLALVRRRLRVRFPDGSYSGPFVYDAIDRRAIDAVVLVAHFEADAEPWVYLRSALRPPVFFRDPARSPTGQRESGGLWELPAGLIEPDEQTAAGVARAGSRELLEELGFAVSEADFQPLGPSTLPCPGVIGERHFFLAIEVDPAARTEPSLDGSALEQGARVISVTLRHALELCRSGRIEDGKTELGLRRLAERLSSEPSAR